MVQQEVPAPDPLPLPLRSHRYRLDQVRCSYLRRTDTPHAQPNLQRVHLLQTLADPARRVRASATRTPASATLPEHAATYATPANGLVSRLHRSPARSAGGRREATCQCVVRGVGANGRVRARPPTELIIQGLVHGRRPRHPNRRVDAHSAMRGLGRLAAGLRHGVATWVAPAALTPTPGGRWAVPAVRAYAAQAKGQREPRAQRTNQRAHLSLGR